MKRLLLIVVIFVAGCASAGGRLVLTEDTIHDPIVSIDKKRTETCTGPQADLLKAPCEESRPILLAAVEAAAAFNLAVQQQKVTSLTDLMAALGKLADVLKKFPAELRDVWELEIAKAISAAYAVVKGGQ